MRPSTDLLIAEEIFRFVDIEECDKCQDLQGTNSEGFVVHIPKYETDISAAWELVKHYHGDGVSIRTGAKSSGNVYQVKIGNVIAFGPTAPEAICNAALKYEGITVC